MSHSQPCCEAVNNALSNFLFATSEIINNFQTAVVVAFPDPAEAGRRLSSFLTTEGQLVAIIRAAFQRILLLGNCESKCCASAARAIAVIGLAYLEFFRGVSLNPLVATTPDPSTLTEILTQALASLPIDLNLVLSTIRCDNECNEC